MLTVRILRLTAIALPTLLILLSRGPLLADLSPSLQLNADRTRLFQSGPPATGLYDETVLRVLELRFEPSDWWQQLTANYGTGENVLADLTVAGTTYPDVGVRFRGNTSYMMTGDSEKKSFNIEMDFVDAGQTLMGYRTLNLNNCNTDASFMREVLYFHEARRYVPTAKANHIRLTINGEDWGVYANVQQINADMIAEWFPSNDGDRWKIEPGGGQGDARQPGGAIAGGQAPPGRQPGGQTPGGQLPGGQVPGDQVPGGQIPGDQVPGGQMPGGGGMASGEKALTWLGTDAEAYMSLYLLKADNTDEPWDRLIALCDVLNNTPLEGLYDGLQPVADVDRWLWFLAVESVLGDGDSYLAKGADYQLYYEPESGRMHPLQYDGNEAFNSRLATSDPMEGEDNANRPAISQLLSVPALRQRYLAHVRTVVEQSLTWEKLGPLVDEYTDLIGAAVRADTRKLYTTEAFDASSAELESFVRTRRTFLLSHEEVSRRAPEIQSVDLDRSVGNSSVTVTVGVQPAADEVLLHWSNGLTGSFDVLSMSDDGAHGDGDAADGTYGADLPLPESGWVRYFVEARADDGSGTVAFAPEGAEHDVYALLADAQLATHSPVLISELMAANQGTVLDPQGDSDDWIELTNVSREQVDLSGMFLSDDTGELRKWALPAGSVLDPGACLVVWADGDEDDAPGHHASFQLSRDGEVVTLTTADGGTLLDLVSFGEQPDDMSYGRLERDAGLFGFLAMPTPGTANGQATTAIDEVIDGGLPRSVTLGQNYPNPFNASTVIPFTVPDVGGTDVEVRLEIYNLSGQRVVSLLAGRMTPGQYSMTWEGLDGDGRHVASGVYLYCLEAGPFRQTRRLLLLQ